MTEKEQEKSVWKSIKTIPKDGTNILVKSDCGCVVSAYWYKCGTYNNAFLDIDIDDNHQYKWEYWTEMPK